MTKEAKKRKKLLSDYKSNLKCTKQYQVRYAKSTNADVIAKLDSVPNRADYIRQLIRADIEKNGI